MTDRRPGPPGPEGRAGARRTDRHTPAVPHAVPTPAASRPRSRRRRAILLLVAAAALLGGAAPDDRAWLVVDAPAPARAQVASSWLEVKGHGGTRRGSGHDVVIALDLSESTLEDTGVDLDGDGPEGRSDPELLAWLRNQLDDDDLPRRFRRQDFEDTVLAAELAAAEALVERLDPARFRVGLVVFSDDARVVAPLDAPRARLAEALRSLRRDFHHALGGTNFAAAVRRAHALLRPADPDAPPDGRLRSIVFLSDGAPTRPVRAGRAERYALDAAQAAGRDGVRLYAFAIGPEAEAAVDVMERMAGWTSGRLEQVSQPASIVARLRRLDLADLARVEVANATTGEPARALRVFPDGSFDGFVPLAPGRNRLRFEARAEDGSRHVVERVVTYRPASGAGADTPDVAAAPAELVERLRRRTAEMEAWADLERGRREGPRQRREVEVAPEARPGSAPSEAP